MRVFYIDEDEVSKKQCNYYVKIANMNVPEYLKGYKSMEASSAEELLEKVKEYYGFNHKPNASIQLWSSQMYTGVRLDTMDQIPKEYEFVWVRVVLNNNDN
jgi:hypothetical protein